MPIVLFSCFCLSAHARVIKGRVLDATTKQAVAYASVTVLSLPDSTVVVDHATTGDDGAFVCNHPKRAVLLMCKKKSRGITREIFCSSMGAGS